MKWAKPNIDSKSIKHVSVDDKIYTGIGLLKPLKKMIWKKAWNSTLKELSQATEAMRHNTEISQDDIGGENCCYRLLRNYQNDIRNTSVEFLRNTKARSRSSCHNKSYIGDRSYIRERFEQKMENTPKIYIKGRYVKQNLIGQATDTENGIIEQNMIYN